MIKNYFKLDIPINNNGFGLFSIGHIFWIVVGFSFTFLICKIYSKSNYLSRSKIKKITSLSALFLLLLKEALLIATDNFTLNDLPLHLCGLTIIFIVIDSFYSNDKFRQFLYAFCFPGAVFAILFPDWSYFPFFNILTSIAFETHILAVTYIVMLTVSSELKPSLKFWYQNLIIMVIIAIPIFVFNKILDLNFMFLNYPVLPLTLFTFLGKQLFFLGYLPLIVITWFIIYFPFFKRRK